MPPLVDELEACPAPVRQAACTALAALVAVWEGDLEGPR